jgi:hypothetical protein
VFILVGGGVGKRALDAFVYSSGPSSLLFYWHYFDKMRGPLLLFWSPTSDPRSDKPWASIPLKWSWGSAGVSTCAHQWDWTQNLYWSQGGPKMDYTNEPSPLRNPINIIFWLLTTSLIRDEHVVSRMPRQQAFFQNIKYSQGFLIT